MQTAFIWRLGENAVTHMRGGSVATDINNAGQVVGYVGVAGQAVAGLVWIAPTAAPAVIFEPLDLRGCDLGSSSFRDVEKSCTGEAASVNDAGEVAGTQFNTAYRWTPGSRPKLLDLPESRASWASGINAQGDIVGHVLISPRNAARPIQEAFVWRSSGEITMLGKLSGTAISVATALNDHGMVVGYAQ